MNQNTQSQSNCAWRNTTQSGMDVEIYHDDGVGDIHGVIFGPSKSRRYLTSWNRDGSVKFCCNVDGVHQIVGISENLVSTKPQIDWSKEEPWVKAIAMDSDGKWYRYEEIPALDESSFRWNPTDRWKTQWYQQIHPDYVPKFDGNWKNSLVIRPN